MTSLPTDVIAWIAAVPPSVGMVRSQSTSMPAAETACTPPAGVPIADMNNATDEMVASRERRPRPLSMDWQPLRRLTRHTDDRRLSRTVTETVPARLDPRPNTSLLRRLLEQVTGDLVD